MSTETNMTPAEVLATLNHATSCVNPMYSPQHAEWHAELVKARAAVATLIAERDKSDEIIVNLESQRRALNDLWESTEAERKRLEAERDALREDAERYRRSFVIPSAADGGLHYIIQGQYGMTSTKDKTRVDSVIDAARAEAGHG